MSVTIHEKQTAQQMSKDVLVIKTNCLYNPDDMEKLYRRFLKQKEAGVVLIPIGFEAFIVPDDIEIKIE